MLNHGGSDQCTGHLALGAAAWSSHPTDSSRTVFFIADCDIPQGEQVCVRCGMHQDPRLRFPDRCFQTQMHACSLEGVACGDNGDKHR